MRLIGIDYGSKKVGVASTDESGQFAIPRSVLKNDKHLLGEVMSMAKKESVERIVLGESKDLSGNANLIMAEILEFKGKLEEGGLEVVLHPEMMTSVEARHLQGSSDMTDASAAALILKSYIDTQNS